MIYGFVKQSKGHIRIYSEVGHGTTAKIYLPRMTEPRGSNPLPRRAAESARIPAASPGEVMLIVEDDEDVLNSTARLAADSAIRSSRPQRRRRARARFRGARESTFSSPTSSSPGMNGRTLSLEAAALRPGLPVLFTTGYARNAIIHDGRLDADVQFLAKPYTQRELAQKLRSVLDVRRRGVE